MLALFFQSLSRHFIWWFRSIWPGRHEGAPLSWRRLVFLLLAYPLFVFAQLIHWFALLCDELFFPKYRKVEVRTPVFVLGIPRSGTTFLHRALAEDREQFTSLSTWEAILAPSITERKCLRALRSIDAAIGAPAYKLIHKILRSSSGDFNDIHEVALSAPEEDYLSLLPAGGCFILLLAFPFATELRQLGTLQTMPENERTRLMGFYKRALQRHLYCHPGKRMLSKNAAFASWGHSLKESFPDAKFLVCIRNPVTALSSQLSSLSPARAFFSTDPDGSHTTSIFTELYQEFYTALADFTQSAPTEQVAVIEQQDLKSASAELIEKALHQLQIKKQETIQDKLAETETDKPSAHHHDPSDFSIDQEEIRRCIMPPYQTMLNCPNRIQPLK